MIYCTFSIFVELNIRDFQLDFDADLVFRFHTIDQHLVVQLNSGLNATNLYAECRLWYT